MRPTWLSAALGAPQGKEEPPAALRSPRRILLVFDACGPGDALCISSYFQAIRETHPAAEIVFLVGERVSPVCKGSQLFDRLVISQLYAPRRISSPWLLRLKKIVELVRITFRVGTGYDLVITFWAGSTLLNLLGWLVGRRRIGYANSIPRLLSCTLGRYDHGQDAFKQHDALFAAANLHPPLPARPLSIRTAEDDVAVEKILAEYGLETSRSLVVLHTGSDWACQQWLPERWATLADKLASDYGADLLFTGVASERRYIESIQSRMRVRSTCLAGRTTLPQVEALLSRARLCVCVDSAIYELTQATGTEAVVLAGPSDPERTVPGPRHPIIVDRASDGLKVAINACKGTSVDWLEQAGCRDYGCPMSGLRDIQLHDVLRAVEDQGVLSHGHRPIPSRDPNMSPQEAGLRSTPIPVPKSDLRHVWMPILLYHRVVPVLPEHDPFQNCTSVTTFESHLRWLATRGYGSLPLSELAELWGPGTGNRRSSPHRSVVITFDDGYRDNYLYAWPLLKRYGFTATIFLVSDAIGGDNAFDAAYGSEPAPMLSLDEIRKMQRGGIGFGSHSCSHPPSLPELADRELKDELERSRSVLEGLLDAPIDHFAYPHSKLDGRVEAAVESAGYRLACAGVGTRFSPFCLHRVEPPARPGVAIEMQMGWRYLKRLAKCRLPGRIASRPPR